MVSCSDACYSQVNKHIVAESKNFLYLFFCFTHFNLENDGEHVDFNLRRVFYRPSSGPMDTCSYFSFLSLDEIAEHSEQGSVLVSRSIVSRFPFYSGPRVDIIYQV